MKAEIIVPGKLILYPESETEKYAATKIVEAIRNSLGQNRPKFELDILDSLMLDNY